MISERMEYLYDIWNYMEVMGFIIYVWATVREF